MRMPSWPMISSIQATGALVGFDPAVETITHASANLGSFLGCEPERALGMSLEGLLARETCHAIRNGMALATASNASEQIGPCKLAQEDFDASLTISDGSVFVEFGPKATPALSATDLLKDLSYLVRRTRDIREVRQLLETSAKGLRLISGYDRVIASVRGGDIAEVVVDTKTYEVGKSVPWVFQNARNRDVRTVFDIDSKPLDVLTDGHPVPNLAGLPFAAADREEREFLSRFDAKAHFTMVLDQNKQRPWGALTLLHKRARVPSTRTRRVSSAFLPTLSAMLALRVAEETAAGLPTVLMR